MSEDQVLAALGAALGSEAPAEGLVVVRTVRRYRSSLYFVGVTGGDVPRWVVKQPDSERRQQDLRSPPDAASQFAAIVKLHEHLAASPEPIAAPRPVALLPQVEALAMEYVPGQTLTGLMRPAVLLRPEPLLEGVAGAARALRLIHEIEPDAVPAGTDAPGRVLLHGDWAPENVLLSGSTLMCLDPELEHRDLPEHDVARFLVMLGDAPLFVTMTKVPAATRLRRRAAQTFLDGYYGESGVSPHLQQTLVDALEARWAMRDQDVTRRRPVGARSRRRLLRWHFTTLLDEARASGWPHSLTPDTATTTAH